MRLTTGRLPDQIHSLLYFVSSAHRACSIKHFILTCDDAFELCLMTGRLPTRASAAPSPLHVKLTMTPTPMYP